MSGSVVNSLLKPVLLWSDLLIYLLALSLLVFFMLLQRKQHTRERWARVFQSPVGMFSFIVILFYVAVALLDSLHFRRALPPPETAAAAPAAVVINYRTEVESVLDVILSDLKNSSERTYSAPFAIYSAAKESLQAADGSTYRDYPRLQYGGAHLKDESERAADLARQCAEAFVLALLVTLLLMAPLRLWRKRRAHPAPWPWATIYGTVFFLVLLASFILVMGSHYHILGTDKAGSDVMYQGIKAIRTGVLMGSLATLLMLPFAISLGIAAGYFKGWVDDVIQFLYTALSSIPDILLIAAAVLVLDVYIESRVEQFELLVQRSDIKFLTLCFILGITSWTGLCRLLRAETLKVSQLDYVQAAVAFGVSHGGILFRHILPNVMHLVLISVVLNFSSFVLAEAVLAYVGVGVDASMISWGNMINGARQELSRDPAVWWTIASAFGWMFLLVLAANLFADQVRDAFDPRSYRGSGHD